MTTARTGCSAPAATARSGLRLIDQQHLYPAYSSCACCRGIPDAMETQAQVYKALRRGVQDVAVKILLCNDEDQLLAFERVPTCLLWHRSCLHCHLSPYYQSEKGPLLGILLISLLTCFIGRSCRRSASSRASRTTGTSSRCVSHSLYIRSNRSVQRFLPQRHRASTCQTMCFTRTSKLLASA